MRTIMQRTLAILVVLSIALFVFGCGSGGGNSPSAVARQFYAAAEKDNFKGMRDLMEPESAQLMAALEEKMEGATGEGGMGDLIKEKGGIVNAEETIDGDTATVKLTFKDESTEDLKLVRIDGKWKITLAK